VPINRRDYADDWDAISNQVRADAQWRCQQCGRPCRLPQETLAEFVTRIQGVSHPDLDWQTPAVAQVIADKPQRWTLTTAHLDQNPKNNNRDNLRALCAPCHLEFDRPHRQGNAYRKRERRGQLPLELAASALAAQDDVSVVPSANCLAEATRGVAEEGVLRQLEQRRDQLAELAADAPDTGWIEVGKVKGKEFRQAWWRGVEMGGKKRAIYIGKEGSPEYLKARAAQGYRKELKKVVRQIQVLKGR
jgi:5-methylcytosine-specific restriction endonuclease McrA